MAVRRAGKKRKKAGSQAGLQSGLLGGDTGAYAFNTDPVQTLGAVLERSGYGQGDADYKQWFQENATADLMGKYNQALTVNKALTYPEFLSQTYGTRMQGPGRLVGKKGNRRRTPATAFGAGNIGQVATQYSPQEYEEQNRPETALNVNLSRLGEGMSSGAQSFLRDQGEGALAKYNTYKQTTPWQGWDDFLNGITTAKPAGYDYDPTDYGYHASTGGGGGGAGKRRRKRGKR